MRMGTSAKLLGIFTFGVVFLCNFFHGVVGERVFFLLQKKPGLAICASAGRALATSLVVLRLLS